jgi:hypothetical protein
MLDILLTSWVSQLLLAIAAIICLIWALYTLINSDTSKWLAILPAILLVLSVWGFFYGQTHRFVRTNQVMLVIDQKTGQPIEPIRTSGVTSVPLWSSIKFVYPAQTVYQWCPVFTPSSKGGASLKTTVCFTADASKINWISQFKAFNGGEATIQAGWQNAVQDSVAVAISAFDPRDMTNKRADVETAIYEQTKPILGKFGFPLEMVGLKDWRFESGDAQTAYDAALLSQTQIDVANSQQQAALIKAQTQVLIAEKQHQACATAGMVSEMACLQYLWMTGGANPSTVILTVGGNNPNIAVPVSTPVAMPTPVPTP